VEVAPILKLYESLVSLSKDPFTVITPLLGRIMNTLPGFVSQRKNNHNHSLGCKTSNFSMQYFYTVQQKGEKNKENHQFIDVVLM